MKTFWSSKIPNPNTWSHHIMILSWTFLVLILASKNSPANALESCMNDGIDYFAGPTESGKCYGPVRFHAGRSTFWDSAEYCQSWYNNASIPRFSVSIDPLTGHLVVTRGQRLDFAAMISLIDRVICNATAMRRDATTMRRDATALKDQTKHKRSLQTSQLCSVGESIYIDVQNRYDLLGTTALGPNKCVRAIRTIPIPACSDPLACWTLTTYLCDQVFDSHASPWVMCEQSLMDVDVSDTEMMIDHIDFRIGDTGLGQEYDSSGLGSGVRVNLVHAQEDDRVDDYSTGYAVIGTVLLLLLSLLAVFIVILRYPSRVDDVMNRLCSNVHSNTLLMPNNLLKNSNSATNSDISSQRSTDDPEKGGKEKDINLKTNHVTPPMTSHDVNDVAVHKAKNKKGKDKPKFRSMELTF